jgi:putative oxygen-independent coproporphyrinogen III oxidase
MITTKKPISIYIHWPFCLSLCPYCDFNSHIASNIDHDKWLKSYEKELEYFSSTIKNKEVKSIFFGGGTPSLMQPFVVQGIIDKIASLGTISDSCEITLEANPTSFETNKFKQFKSAGINRVSIGVQSFNEKDLSVLGRKHSGPEAINAIESASNIFRRYSFDLIYARPNQTFKKWQEELKFALTLANGHISLYQLTIEKGTPFFNLFRSNQLCLPSNDDSAELYEWTGNFLKENNYNRYEISNYSKLNEECIHNLCYWNYNEYIGIGPGAHGRIHYKTNVSAVMMHHKPDKWLNAVESQGHGIQNNINLSTNEIIEELIMMGTRLANGITEESLQKLLKLKFSDILNQDILKQYINHQLVSLDNNILKLSDSGLLLHNYLIARLIKAIPAVMTSEAWPSIIRR